MDAGGLVIATDQSAARAYAALLKEISGEPPVVVVSDDATSSDKIERFTTSQDRWMVAVRMVSEGVDVPRLAVGVYATSTSTPLFFAQAVGRFVRARRRGETASVFLPSVPTLLEMAGQLELERDHAIGAPAGEDEWVAGGDGGLGDGGLDDAALAAANRAEAASSALDGPGFQALEAQATFDRVLFDKQEYGLEAEVGSEHEQGFLELPGLLEPEEVTSALRVRQARQLAAQRRSGERGTVAELATHREVAALRKELHSLVGAWARRTGQPHGTVHAELRRTCGGPEVATASAEQIGARITTLRNWFVGRR